MSLPLFRRLIWKEYRLQRALWLAVAAISSLLMLLVYAVGAGSLSEAEQWHPLFGIALVFPALYALGCGAVLFAGEHEAGTYEFERALPARRKCFSCKSCRRIAEHRDIVRADVVDGNRLEQLASTRS